MDEPCSALDPTSTRRVEETIAELRGQVTVVIVTHNMQQAHRVSDHCAFFLAAENEPGLRRRAGPDRDAVHQPRRPPHARLRAGPLRMRRGCVRRTLLVGAIAVAGSRRRRRRRPATAAKINGSGSTYVALAMQQWVADAQTSGLQVNYLPTGSPQGLTQFGQNLIDFAGTEAEYSALGSATPGAPTSAATSTCPTSPARWPSCTTSRTRPAARSTTCTCRARRSPASSSATSAAGPTRPSAPTTRASSFPTSPSPSCTAAASRARRRCSTTSSSTRSRQVHRLGRRATSCRRACASSSSTARPSSPPRRWRSTAPTRSPSTSPAAGKWAIAYDEFGYAKTLRAAAAWVQNQAGQWVLPYAQNISAALEAAKLRPDLSQELSGVYASANPEAYPISAYSYMVTQCAPSGPAGDLQGRLHEPRRGRDAREVDALHRLRRPGEHGPHRLLAAAAQPVAGDRQLDRPHAGHGGGGGSWPVPPWVLLGVVVAPPAGVGLVADTTLG